MQGTAPLVRAERMKMRIGAAGALLAATLDDTEAAKDFATSLQTIGGVQ